MVSKIQVALSAAVLISIAIMVSDQHRAEISSYQKKIIALTLQRDMLANELAKKEGDQVK